MSALTGTLVVASVRLMHVQPFLGIGRSPEGCRATSDRAEATIPVESPQLWFEDFGSGVLAAGTARVPLDPVFAETANADMQYYVFLTPRGDCEGLYLASQSSKGFEVRELRGGKSDVPFDYRIVAHRRGFETHRLEDATDLFNIALPGQSVVP